MSKNKTDKKGLDISALRDEDAELSVWLPYANGAEVLIAYIPAEELDSLVDSCKERKYKRHQPVEEVNTEELFLRIGRRCVIDWKKIVDKGRPLPCTDENRDFLMLKLTGFGQFVQDSATEFTNFIKDSLEKEGNSSGPTSGPVETSQE